MNPQMTQSPGGQEPLWQPFKIEDTFGATSFGGDNRIKRVWFHVLGAQDSYVDVPFSQFTAAQVAALIEQHVSDIVDVLQLKGQSF